MRVMPPDFKRVKNHTEYNRYYETGYKNGYIDFESQASVFHFTIM